MTKMLGNIYIIYGDYKKAITYHIQYLKIIIKFSNILTFMKEKASINSLIGLSYYYLQQHSKSLEYYQQSLLFLGEDIIDVDTLSSIGNNYYALGDLENAVSAYQKSLDMLKKKKNQILSTLPQTLDSLIIRNPDKKYKDSSSTKEAMSKELSIDYYYSIIFCRVGGINLISNIAYFLEKERKIDFSILMYKYAISQLEKARYLMSISDELAAYLFISEYSFLYQSLTKLLLNHGRVMEALQVLDLLKVQELDGYLKNIKGNGRTIKGIRILESEEKIFSNLLSIRLEKSSEINRQLANQFQQLPKSEINKVPDYLNQIPQGTVLLYPFILGDRLEIILFSPNSLPINRTVKISKDQLQELVTEFRAGLQNNGYADVKIPAAKLYDLLIKPIEAELIQFKADTILYAPDGQLRYVPLAALYDGKQWLIEKYRISNLIAYTLTDFTANPKTQPSILAGAYGNGNHKSGEATLSPLPATIKEVQAIANSFTNSVTFIEDKFSRPAIESQLKNYNILHLATHAEFNTGVPDNSFIIFGNGDKIRLNEITDWQIPNINLIILSACQTGLGKLGEGVEILGFGYQVQKAGAKNAIASLWKVDDAGTQALMEAFYGELKKGDVTITEALRRAQIAMIKSDQKGTGSDRAGIRIVGTVPSSSSLSHPYYWSAFFAIGNGL
ncbi:CHAT domain-containing protein [Pseudanabaena sp. SR411]|uniref:CHAT domain-containing protein n=1 Tax=Pseudanabaena sp. SR411 TaxID=1980935 RepID=UPI0015963748|nr:CHAT domain-containing protein [Pseudanabaena sp. SR411]